MSLFTVFMTRLSSLKVLGAPKQVVVKVTKFPGKQMFPGTYGEIFFYLLTYQMCKNANIFIFSPSGVRECQLKVNL